MSTINIERLTVGTMIYVANLEVKGASDFYTVQAVQDQPDDGSFYVVLATDGWRDELGFTVPYGGTVEFGGVGEPDLVPIERVSLAALQARIVADDAAIDAGIQEQNRRAQFFGAVARALGVPALEAAE